jgi:hypothetical protein
VTEPLGHVVHCLRNDCALENEDGSECDVESGQEPNEQLQSPRVTLISEIDDLEVAPSREPNGEARLTFPHIPRFLYRLQVAFA